ncbi:unnamed protein product [Rotaria sordida]|uniref:Transmembrane protein 19 n=1 Tax=Rotaria sordida TaxID=392033 RepID=A0A815P9P8_9BILA|nr:unnamed protein product [Rotaria sordida]
MIIKYKQKKNIYIKTARDHIQVLCNGSIACLYAIGYCWKRNYSGLSVPIDNKYASSIYSIGFIFTIACCCDDTLASEFGSVQAQNNPRLLTNPFRIVPVGTNDAISLVGCSSIDSLLGATLQFSGYDRERNVTVQIPGPSIE